MGYMESQSVALQPFILAIDLAEACAPPAGIQLTPSSV